MSFNVTNNEIDAKLISELRAGGAGSRAALAQIFRQLQPRMLTYLRRRGADAETANDLCQDLFVRVMERIGDYRGDARFDAWAFSILKNLWIDRLRGTVTEIELPDDATIEPISFPQLCTDDLSASSLAHRRVLSALDAFSLADPQSAHLIELRVFEGWGYDELATYYGTTPAAVRERVSYVRKKLERFLGPLLDFLRANRD